MSYSFDVQMSRGDVGEATLDQYFRKLGKFRVVKVDRSDQRRGIDRRFVWPDGRVQNVEYKTDYRAWETGNAFVETVSVDATAKPGWAVSSQAEILAYYVPQGDTVYILKMAEVQAAVKAWKKLYPERSIPNNGYKTKGLLVPLDHFERMAVQVVVI